QNMPEYYKIKEEAVTIGGLPAIKRFYTWNKIHREDNSKIPIKAVDIYLLKDKKGYILEGQVVQDKFEQILPELEIMFNNFTLSGATSEPVTSEPGLPPVTVTSETVSSSNAPSTIEEITFKFCPYCGAPLQPDYKFCPGCGKPIPAQRSVKAPKKIGARNGNQTNINYSENLIQTRGFSEENNQFNYPRGMNKSYSKPFKSYKPAFISRSFGSKLVRLFPEKPLFPWAVSKRIMFGNYANLFPGSLGRKISSQGLVIRSAYPTNLNFSYLKGLGKQIAFNPGLGTTFRGGTINQLGSSLKNLGEGIGLEMVVSQAPSLGKTWVLRSSKRGAQDNVSMGSSIGRISSKIGSSVVDQIRSSSSLGGCFSVIGQGVASEIGIKREGETLPSLTSEAPQTAPVIPETPPAIGPEGIVSPTPGASEQGGITLTPPGQPIPAQSGTGGLVLPSPGGGGTQQPEIIWKQYSLNQAFGHNMLITGYLEYPSTWLVNLDSFNKSVTFSEDTSGLVSLTLFPGLMGQFNSAQDLAQQVAYLLQQQVPDLSIVNQEFKIVPSPGGISGAIELTNGKVYLRGTYQGSRFSFSIETMALYTGVFGAQSMGFAAITQASEGVFVEKEQKYFNRMIISYKKSLGIGMQ
ncbi:zinc-ribbon domain-containing protein, partial [bacterium]|nr:zinc-ribbon domain-containing protein [bacterium]